MFKNIIYSLQSLVVYLLFFIGRIIGLKTSRKIFAFIFSTIGPFFKSEKIIKNNLNIFSNIISNSDKKKITNNMWKNYGMTFIEYVYLDQLKKNNDHITVKNKEILSLILKEKKPVIFVSGHFANFELMSMEIVKNNIPLATIYRPLNNIFLNPFMEYLRKKHICKNQIKKGIGGLKDLLKLNKEGCSTALMIDQRVSEGSKLDFFNEKAFTTTIPAQLVKKFNIPVVPIFIERFDGVMFKMKVYKPIYFPDSNSIDNITGKLNKILEKMILDSPNYWIWSHNRWK